MKMTTTIHNLFCNVLSLLCVAVTVVATQTSSMFLNTQSAFDSDSCVEGLSRLGLEEFSAGQGNMSYFYNNLLRRIARERVSGTTGNRIVRNFIRREMQSLGWTVETDTFLQETPLGTVEFSNVVATWNPLVARRVVVACHYDSKRMRGYRFIGAIDSVVPCSLMIDTARKLTTLAQHARSNNLSDISLQFIFFDGEEAFVRWSSYDSLYGSRHLAQLWEDSADPNDVTVVNNLENIDLFILLDLIGNYRTKLVDYYRNTSHLFTRMVDIENCLRSSDLLVSARNRPQIFDPRGRASLVEDDHTPFVQRGVPVLHLISTPFPSVWHTPYDTLRYLNPPLIDDFARTFRVFLATLLLGL